MMLPPFYFTRMALLEFQASSFFSKCNYGHSGPNSFILVSSEHRKVLQTLRTPSLCFFLTEWSFRTRFTEDNGSFLPASAGILTRSLLFFSLGFVCTFHT
ncbi:hypothetical protein XENORESO_018291 [Xenotaenia resolanae]|uniref:Uncharacterized protein n=1 Tax=Xenotaenia resolanae TaxID=208358 RepID=A0ABV0WTK2_9TELE